MAEDEEDALVSLKGEIVDLSSRFWSEGWGFGKLRTGVNSDPIKITGILEGFKVGMVVSVSGRYKHGKHGVELRLESITAEDPVDMRGIRQWLIDRIPQIGPKRAEEVAKRFGKKIWDVLDQSPDDLIEVDGITPARVEDIKKAWSTHKEERMRFVPYYDAGLTQREAKQASEKEVAVSDLLTNPFILYVRIAMNFARNEVISDNVGASRDASYRLLAAVIDVVREASSDGHTAVESEYVVEHAAALSSAGWKHLREALFDALDCGFLETYDGMIMLPKYARAEAGIADKIKHLLEEAQNDRDQSGPDARGGGGDDAQGEGGNRDGRPRNGEVDDPSRLSGSGRES